MNFLVFTDDWGRHPSSCQHLMRFFLKKERGHHVIWMNTIGTRSPGLDMVTLRRGFGKIFHWMGQKKISDEKTDELRPEIHHPLMYPWFRYGFERKINRFYLQKAVKRALKNVSGPVTAITTLPIVADLVGEAFPDSPISRWVYYCVDDWSQWPGADAAVMNKMEQELLAKVDVVVCAGVALQERLRGLGRESHLLTHGVDLEHWGFKGSRRPPGDGELPNDDPSPFPATSPISAQEKLPADSRLAAFFAELERPFYTFWGLIDERLDLELVTRLADDITAGTLIFAGPEASRTTVAGLSHPRIRIAGRLHYSELPQLAHASDVLIMPYRDIAVTRQMQPLKMTEYLASGRPAVVRRLPACEAWQDALDRADTPEEFSRLARLRAETGLPASQLAARRRLEAESWEAKAKEFERIVLPNTAFHTFSPSVLDAGGKR